MPLGRGSKAGNMLFTVFLVITFLRR